MDEVFDTCYCTYINDTVYCNGICSKCGNKDIKLDDEGHPIWE